MKKTIKLILIALTILATEVNAQDNKGQAPAMQLANYVNPFTGDFSYSIPLIGVTGPNGESFPLNLNYAGGIKVDQQASWVGLGWDLNIGEINRQVNGMPDDYNNAINSETTYTSNGIYSPTPKNTNVFGPLYFDQVQLWANTTTKMDLYGTNHMIGDNYFIFPDYDDYYASGPGIGGMMRPFLFDFAEYAPYIGDELYPSRQPRKFSKKPMFRFVDEPMANLTNNENFRGFINKTTPLSWYVEPLANNNKGKIWKNRNGNDNIFDAGNYVEYFTNNQIYKHYTGTPSEKIAGFIDCSEVIDRTANPNAIGAFRITTPNGMVYHYSLPVYTADDEVKAFETNNFNYTSVNKLITYSNNTKHAYTWKLTAKTDVTFQDINGNSKVDEADKGYWISVAYSKWANNFNWRFPYYNFYPDATSNKIPSWNEGERVYAPSGTLTDGNSEIYYPEFIKTATQTMYFIKDVRADDHSVENTSNNKYTPKLLLKYILLFDNDDVADHNIFSVRQSIDASAVSTKLEMPTSDVLNTEDYDYYQSEIETYALKVIDFDFDYHLSQKLTNNINNIFSETTYNITLNTGTKEVFKDGTFSSTTDLNQSGKLTLKKVTTFNLNHQQKQPPYLFEYNNENPDFKQEQQDIFGYHKENFNSLVRDQYIIRDSAQVDAWSLSKIITPLGGEIAVEYESDTYNGVVYDSENVPKSPTRLINNSENLDIAFYTPKAISSSVFNVYGQNYTEFILNEVYGGGIRVKSISLTDSHSGELYQLSYSYNDGIATVEPDRYQRSVNHVLIKTKSRGDRHAGSPAVGYSNVKITIGNEITNIGSIKNNYKNFKQPYDLNTVVEEYQAEDSESDFGYYNIQLNWLPQASDGTLEGWYEFPIGTPPFEGPFGITYPTKIEAKKMFKSYKLGLVTAQSNLTNFGKLNSSSIYDANNVVVSKTIYEYGGINEVYLGDDIGRVQEVFYDYGDYRTGEDERTILKTIFIKTNPVTHLKKETILKDGIVTVVNYAERDNFTGLPTKIVTTASGYAENILEKTYAYETNSAMGAKTTNPSNLNILTPVQEEIESRGSGSKYEWDNEYLIRSWDNTNQKYISSSQPSAWSPIEIYTFNGLNAGTPLWKKLGSSTLYGGRNSTERIERKDMKDGYSAVKFGYDNRFKIAEVSNCNYASFAYSSFESLNEVASGVYHFDGEVIKGSSNRVGITGSTGSIVPHTGDYMAEVPSGQYGASFKSVVYNQTISGEDFERGIQVGRTYVASVWVHKDSPDEAKLVFSLDGNVSDYKSIRKDDADAIQIGDWIQLNLTFTVPENYVSSGGPLSLNDMRVYMWNTGSSSAYYDDLVIHPVDAQFTGYVYNERLGLVDAVIGNDNFYTRFEYDNSGEVISTFKETPNGEKLIKSSDYNFKRN